MSVEDDAFNAAIAYYLKKQNSKTPNFYPQPLTPEDQWKQDQIQKLYGGTTGFVNNMLSQDLNPKDFKFVSPMFQGQQFAGGVQARPAMQPGAIGGTGGGAGSNPVGGFPGKQYAETKNGGSGDGQVRQHIFNRIAPSDSDGTNGWGTSIYDMITTGGVMPSDYGRLFPQGQTPAEAGQIASGTKPQGDMGSVVDDFRRWLSEQIKNHPELARLGKQGLTTLATAAYGPFAGLAAKYGPSVVGWIIDHVTGGSNASLPPGTSQPPEGSVPGAPPLP